MRGRTKGRRPARRSGVVETTDEDWRRVLDINLTGPMYGTRAAAPLIRDSGGGSIVNTSSTAGLTAHFGAAYTASKWGLRGLTKTAAGELAAWGIRVNSVHPGQVTVITARRAIQKTL